MEVLTRGALVTLLLGFIGYIWNERNKQDEKEKKALKDIVETHIKECNEVPKSLLLEKLNNLCEKQDDYQAANGEKFIFINDELLRQRDRAHSIKEEIVQLTLAVATIRK